MTITREQIEGLCRGDIVELRHRDWGGAVLRGPVSGSCGSVVVGGQTLRTALGGLTPYLINGGSLTVVERAPAPLYTNHLRFKPHRGDVARDAEDPWNTRVWLADEAGDWWTAHGGTVFMAGSAALIADDIRFPERLRLLVDGEKGDIVQ